MCCSRGAMLPEPLSVDGRSCNLLCISRLQPGKWHRTLTLPLPLVDMDLGSEHRGAAGQDLLLAICSNSRTILLRVSRLSTRSRLAIRRDLRIGIRAS